MRRSNRSRLHQGPPSGTRRKLSPREQWEQEMVRKFGLEDVAWDPSEHCDCCAAEREALAEEAREAREEAARKARDAAEKALEEALEQQAREELEREEREAAAREAGELEDEDDDEAEEEEPLSLRGEALQPELRILH